MLSTLEEMHKDWDVSRLSDAEIKDALGQLDGWDYTDGVIVKEFRFDGFPEAVAFVGRLVEPAEAANHHPDLEIHYNRVVVALSTHSEGGVTAKDMALAGEVDARSRG
jgi:4a-hydroxytetrahydrobiopterin dehydratase